VNLNALNRGAGIDCFWPLSKGADNGNLLSPKVAESGCHYFYFCHAFPVVAQYFICNNFADTLFKPAKEKLLLM